MDSSQGSRESGDLCDRYLRGGWSLELNGQQTFDGGLSNEEKYKVVSAFLTYWEFLILREAI